MYDGHGSTRQLIASNGTTVVDGYSYDAYGVILGGNPAQGSTPATNLLYAGEQFDTDAQQYYLRARYYNPLNGLFNRTDPFSGNPQDPQSLHKYLYCHNNPVNYTDPSGRFTIPRILIAVVIIAIVAIILYRTNFFEFWRKGLQSSTILDTDIITAIQGYTEANKALNEVLELDTFNSYAELLEQLEEKDVYMIGEHLRGPVGYGKTLSLGQRQILRYFEFDAEWINAHPEAHEHPLPSTYGGNKKLFAQHWGEAESRRMDVIIHDLEVEARRRGIQVY